MENKKVSNFLNQLILSANEFDCHLSKVFRKRNIGGGSPQGMVSHVVDFQPPLGVMIRQLMYLREISQAMPPVVPSS